MSENGVPTVVQPETDEELMVQVAHGSHAAFARLFDRYQVSVSRFAYRFVGNRARAEEAAQEVFLKLYQSAGTYRPRAKFRTYLFRVAANHCLNEVRRGEYRMKPAQEPERPAPLDALSSPGERPDEALHAKQLEQAVSQALQAMTERERAAFALCRFEGLSYREVAEALSASESAVKSLIHRATLALAKKLDALEAAGPAARSEA